MAFKLLYYIDNPNKGYRFFLCDLLSDVQNLPTQNDKSDEYPNGTPAGSMALVVETGNTSVWVLNNSNVWVQI